MQKIIGYHGTKSKNVDSILKEGFKIAAVIEAENILDLDKPFVLKQFKEYQEALEEQFINQGIVLDFSKGIGKPAERIRCFWMDAVKEAYNIQVIIYTFTRKNPSYVDSKYHIYSEDEYSLANMGLLYHERQICVTANCYIVESASINKCIEDFDEVIV